MSVRFRHSLPRAAGGGHALCIPCGRRALRTAHRAFLAQQKFRRSLANLLPQGGTTHRTQDGDFRWEVGFCFDETDFPDGSTGKGVFVQCRNFYGKLSLFRAYDGKSFRCTVQDQDAFLQQVYGIISSEP